MKLLAETGEYQISEDELSKIKGDFVGYACSMKRQLLSGGCLRMRATSLDTPPSPAASDKVFERWWATNKECGLYQPLHLISLMPGSVLAGNRRRSIRRYKADMERLSNYWHRDSLLECDI